MSSTNPFLPFEDWLKIVEEDGKGEYDEVCVIPLGHLFLVRDLRNLVAAGKRLQELEAPP